MYNYVLHVSCSRCLRAKLKSQPKQPDLKQRRCKRRLRKCLLARKPQQCVLRTPHSPWPASEHTPLGFSYLHLPRLLRQDMLPCVTETFATAIDAQGVCANTRMNRTSKLSIPYRELPRTSLQNGVRNTVSEPKLVTLTHLNPARSGQSLQRDALLLSHALDSSRREVRPKTQLHITHKVRRM